MAFAILPGGGVQLFAWSDLLIINKIDLVPMVGAGPYVMARRKKHARRRPFVFTNLRIGAGQDAVITYIEQRGALSPMQAQGQ